MKKKYIIEIRGGGYHDSSDTIFYHVICSIFWGLLKWDESKFVFKSEAQDYIKKATKTETQNGKK